MFHHRQLKLLLPVLIAASSSLSLPANSTIITSGYIGENYEYSQLTVGGYGFSGDLEINASPLGNGETAMSRRAVMIGVDGGTGTVSVVGDGTSGSARLDILPGVGLRNGMGGNGTLNISSGGIVESHAENIYLGAQNLDKTPTVAVTNIDGSGSILRTNQSTSLSQFDRADGGRIYVGDGASNSTSTVNITNGGLMEALSGNFGSVNDYGHPHDDGSIWIGTSAYSGATATVNVSGVGSTMRASTYIEVGGRSDNVQANLNVTEGGRVEITQTDPAYAGSLWINAFNGDASVRVNGAGSSIAVEEIQVGARSAFVGFTADGAPVKDIDWESMIVGQPVTDLAGNPVYHASGNPVLVILHPDFDPSYNVLVPETELMPNPYRVNDSGNMIVEQNGLVTADVINVAVDSTDTVYLYGQPALTVRDGGTVQSNVNLNNGGLLNGDGGLIVGNVTVNNGTVAPGNSPGTLTIDGDLTFNSGTLELEFDSPTQIDHLFVSGDIFFSSTSTIDLLFGYQPMETLFLEDFFSGYNQLLFDELFDPLTNIRAIFDELDTFSINLSFADQLYNFTELGASQIKTTEVPEPSSLLLLLLGLAGIAFKRRRVV